MIVLFDMDGTLTPPREEISWDVVKTIKKLSKYSRIGIISGSDMEYITQQCDRLFSISGCDPNMLDILPCNGTKLYKWKYTKYETAHEADMIGEIGKHVYKNILSKIFEWQAEITKFYPDLPYSGTFVQYRGSLLNWCPIGRSANLTQRAEWKQWDLKWQIRKIYTEELQKYIDMSGLDVTVALGGSTSFDIYPLGWNKTYGLKHYPDEDVYFIGDKCTEGGNDWHIYEALQKKKRSWSTTGPNDTIEIVNSLIESLKAV